MEMEDFLVISIVLTDHYIRETFDVSYSESAGVGWGHSLGSLPSLATGNEAYSASFPLNTTGGPTTSSCTKLIHTTYSS